MSDSDLKATSEVNWIPAREALALVQDRNGPYIAEVSIAKRANAGRLRALADMFRKEVADRRGDKRTEVERQVELPSGFWWAKGAIALEQNWEAGDFSTWIDQKYEWQAFGVMFDRAGIEAMLAPKIHSNDIETAVQIPPQPGPIQSVVERSPPGPKADPDWDWAVFQVTQEVLKAGYTKSLERGGKAAIQTQLLSRMAERGKFPSDDSARNYAKRVINALPEN